MAMNITPRKVAVMAAGYALQAVGVVILILTLAAVAGLAVRIFTIVAGLA